MTNLLEQLNAEMASVSETVRRSLVHVADGWRGGGAGVIVHPDGLVVTNAHVVRRRTLEARLADGRTLPARLLAFDRGHDLAALSIEADDLPALEIGDSRRLHPGDWLLAFGHPWGVDGAATAGVVIGVGPDLPAAPPSPAGSEWIAVDLHLRPGNSGGPLVDNFGRLVGVNTMMAGPDVGLAVPSHIIKRFLRGALGREEADEPEVV